MISQLQRFAVPGKINIDAGCGGLPRISLATPLCRGEIYLHGAHITAWQPAGHAPVLWMSTQSWFAQEKPIRGGIPICWPWFGPSTQQGQPAHGFARLADWTLENVETNAECTVIVSLGLKSTEPAASLRLTARFGSELRVELTATNTGNTSFPVSEAFHTYLAVEDIRGVSIRGLEGAAGWDRVAEPFQITGHEVLSVGAETDLMFNNHIGEVMVQDTTRTVRVSKRGSLSTVIWNPWIAKAARMPDFGDHEWPGMLCVEAANALSDSYTLAPGATHTLATTLEVDRA